MGEADKETLTVLSQIKLTGRLLNVAAGDGRFITKLFESADSIVTLDNDETKLAQLYPHCPTDLSVELVDITKLFPFDCKFLIISGIKKAKTASNLDN